MSGLKIAALYGLKPHQLGLCGPQEAARNQTLQKFLKREASPQTARKALEQFKGAYPYYRLIAKSNGIKNPFARKVVKAYWVGNELLDKVKTEDLRNMVAEDFSGAGLLSKKTSYQKAKSIPEGAKPHHSFHVLFIGSVTGSVDFKDTAIKDVCRVGWGKVTQLCVTPAEAGIQNSRFRVKHGMTGKNTKHKIIVLAQPLIGEKKIRMGKTTKKEIVWNKDILPKLKIGDWVSFHWDQAVEILTDKEAANLEKYTETTLSLL